MISFKLPIEKRSASFTRQSGLPPACTSSENYCIFVEAKFRKGMRKSGFCLRPFVVLN